MARMLAQEAEGRDTSGLRAEMIGVAQVIHNRRRESQMFWESVFADFGKFESYVGRPWAGPLWPGDTKMGEENLQKIWRENYSNGIT